MLHLEIRVISVPYQYVCRELFSRQEEDQASGSGSGSVPS